MLAFPKSSQIWKINIHIPGPKAFAKSSRERAYDAYFEFGKSSHLQPLAPRSHLQPLEQPLAASSHLSSHLQPLATTCPQQPLAATCPQQPLAPTGECWKFFGVFHRRMFTILRCFPPENVENSPVSSTGDIGPLIAQDCLRVFRSGFYRLYLLAFCLASVSSKSFPVFVLAIQQIFSNIFWHTLT